MSDYYNYTNEDPFSDYKDDFSEYIPSTIRPGFWLSVAVIIYSTSSVLVLPFKTVYDNRRKAKYSKCEEQEKVKEKSNSQSEGLDDNLESNERVIDVELNNTGPYSVKAIPACHDQIQILEIIRCDEESKRIVSLALPFTLSSVLEELFQSMTLIVIGKYLGSASLTAYVCVDLLLGLTDSFIHGVTQATSTLCTHAIGSENYLLAGQFMQMSTIIYLCTGGPFLVLWYFLIGDVLQLMGLETNFVDLAVDYTRIVAFHFILDGLLSWALILEVNGQEVFTSTIGIIEGGINFALVLACCATIDTYSLYWVGVTQLLIAIFFAFILVAVALYKGWLSPFFKGFIHSNGFKNGSALTQLFRTAIPLAFSSLLEYGEWGLLVFFAIHIGQAEVAAWGIIGSLWDLLIASIYGLSESACIRVASLLGKGDIKKAQNSAYKSLFMSLILSGVNSLLILSLSNVLPGWLTKDETLNQMIKDLIPFLAISSIPLGFVTVLWEIIGAQGRYGCTTCVYFSCFFWVILPLSAAFTFYFNYNLLGLLIAVITGWSTIGLTLSYILYSSDWKQIAVDIASYSEEYDSSDTEELSGEEDIESSDCESSDESVMVREII